MSPVVIPFFWVGATPRARRTPFIVSRTSGSVHGLGWPDTLWPSPMAASLRVIVETRAGVRSSGGSASSATYPATTAGAASRASTPSCSQNTAKSFQSER